jgi:nucleotide-binding universal stress UspA family protein
MAKIDKILVAVDMSKHSKNALDYASLMAEKCRAELILVNVFDAFERVGSTRKKLEEIAEMLRKDSSGKLNEYVNEARKLGVTNVRAERIEGNPAEMILKIARREKPDMIVVGSRGLSTAKEFLLGSVSHKITHHASCPVLIVR